MCGLAVDKDLIACRFLRSLSTYEHAAIVQRHMAEQLVAELGAVSGADRFDRVLELGCGTGLLTERLIARCRPCRLVLNDLVRACAKTADRARQRNPHLDVQFLPGDMESLDFPHPQDLIVSNAVFQWAADPQALLARMAALLRDGGILGVATFGPSNLREVTRLTGLSLAYRTAKQWQTNLAAHYEVISVREDVQTLRFHSPREVLRHLKETGVNALDGRPWSRARITDFCRAYEATFAQQDEVPLTYHPIIITARKRRTP